MREEYYGKNIENHIGGGQRNSYIDLVKGIGIVLMVLRHARAPFSDFVLLFHMAIFFIASGYLIKEENGKNARNLLVYIWHKIRGLYIPYIAYSIIFICLHNVFLKLNIYTNAMAFMEETSLESTYKTLFEYYTINDIILKICKAAIFRASTQVGGAFWFFQVLLIDLIAYAIVDFIFGQIFRNKKRVLAIQGAISILLLLIGYYCCVTGKTLHGLNRECSVYVLIYVGVILKRYNIMEKLQQNRKILYIAVVSFMILCLGYHRGYIAIDGNHIENPVFFLVMSCSGWFLLYGISVLLEKYTRIVASIFIYISKHSVAIIALHFLAFKIVNACAVALKEMPKYMIAAFPVLMTDGLWWLLYATVGIAIPLCIDFNVRYVKCLMRKRKGKS